MLWVRSEKLSLMREIDVLSPQAWDSRIMRESRVGRYWKHRPRKNAWSKLPFFNKRRGRRFHSQYLLAEALCPASHLKLLLVLSVSCWCLAKLILYVVRSALQNSVCLTVYSEYILLVRSFIDPTFCGIFVCDPLQFECQFITSISHFSFIKTAKCC